MRSSSRSGFTLMEVLVALFIAALVMTAVLSSLDYTQRAVDAIHNVIETESAGPRILKQMREDLSRIAVYDAPDYLVLRGESNSYRGADADRLDFLVYRRSTQPYYDFDREKRVWAPLLEVGYRVRPNPIFSDFLELHRREDFLHDQEPFKDGKYSLLYDRVTSLNFTYYSKPELDPVWEEEWDSQELEALPHAIQVYLELEIQPRRSMESLGILGANRARLEFDHIVKLPEEVRWVLRQRLHPTIPGPGDSTETLDGPGSDGPDGEGGGGGGGGSGMDLGGGGGPSRR